MAFPDNALKRLLEERFSPGDRAAARRKLESIGLRHVMAESQENLDATWAAVITLSNGDLSRLDELITAAKADFRDVIYWARLQDEEA